MKNIHIFRSKWQHQIETFLHRFSLTNAEVAVTVYKSVKPQDSKSDCITFSLYKTPFLLFLYSHLESSKSLQRCHGGHPDIGDSLLLSIPPKAMEQGLFGTVTLGLVTLLKPCVLQYPNVETHLTQIKISLTVLVYSPSNVPDTNPSAFMQNFPTHLNCRELGLQNLSFQGKCTCCICILNIQLYTLFSGGDTVYKMEQVNSPEGGEKSNLFSIDQSVLLFLFLQHTDPFTTEISDIMTNEVLLEHHLEDILIYNKEAVTNAVANELKKTMTAQNNRKKASLSCEVILSSALDIITCSSNMDFRNACMNTMKVCDNVTLHKLVKVIVIVTLLNLMPKVHDTQQMSVAVCELLKRVIFWKFSPKRICCSDQVCANS
uniref:Uncharacterized protein n=1 Tax=Periophthalmus magnuspinnatus TaxID=409849 RepID=A0A3B3ZT72_9GOBI